MHSFFFFYLLFQGDLAPYLAGIVKRESLELLGLLSTVFLASLQNFT